MFFGKLQKNAFIGGKTCLGLFNRGKLEFFKEDMRKLFWGIEVKLLAGKRVEFADKLIDFFLAFPGKFGQQLFVYFNAVRFHLKKHKGKRDFGFLKKFQKRFLL